MSLTELYSAMVEQVADRLAAERRTRRIGRTIGGSQGGLIAHESERIRRLELENAEIKAGFSAFVNLLMRKGVIQHEDLEGIMKSPEAQLPAPPVKAEPLKRGKQNPRKQRKRRKG